MAVQVPRLQKIETGKSLPQNDRINMQVRDNASSIMNQTQAVTAIGDKVGDIYQQYENDKIETLSGQAERDYTAWNNEQLGRLKKYQGDPTDAYVEYDKKAKEKRDEILAARPDLNDRVKRHFTSRFDKSIEIQNIYAMKQRGMQQEVYENNSFEASLKLKKEGLPNSVGLVTNGDYSPVDSALGDIKDTIVRRGLKTGLVKQLPDDAETGFNYKLKTDDLDENGKNKYIKVSLSDAALVRVAKEQSEGVKNSFNILLTTDSPDRVARAKEFKEKYQSLIDDQSLSSINKKMTKETINLEARNFLNDFKGTPSKLIEEIETIDKPELKEKVLQLKAANDGRIQALKNNFNKVNTEHALKRINTLREAGKEFHNFSDFESDPVAKQIEFDKLDSKHQEAIKQAVIAPKKSDEKAISELQNLFIEKNEDLNGMSFETFQREHLVNVSQADRKKYTNKFEKYKNPSAGSERANVRMAGQLLKEQMISAKYISADKMTEKDKRRLSTMNDKLLDHISEHNITSPDQIRKLTKELVSKGVLSGVRSPSQEDTPVQNIKGMDRVKIVAAYKNAKKLNVNPLFKDIPQSWIAQNKEKVLSGK